MGVCMLLVVAGGISPLLMPVVAFLKWKGLNYLLAASGFFLVAGLKFNDDSACVFCGEGA